MSNEKQNQKIEKACISALEKFAKINLDEYADIISKLEYVLGSYSFDKNPIGLYEVGGMALELLKTYKEKKPKDVSQKLITDLEKAVAEA